MKLCVVGLGYIGLPTSAIFADSGAEVVGVDVHKHVVDTINGGSIHIEEPGLEEIVCKTVKNGHFRASLTPEKADAFIIAVPTPNKDDQYLSCDLTYVESAITAILPYVEKGNVVIVESTIAPRSMQDHMKPLFEQAGFAVGKDVFVAHCPERVLPGQILHELIYNNRVVGGLTPACTEAGAKVYATVVKGEIIKTEASTAEMAKLMENTFRDVNIALANELAKIGFELGINALDVIKIANMHPRVNLHTPGPGVGGHCLAVDPYFIYAKAPETAHLIKHARDINNSMPHYVADQSERLLGLDKDKKITALGATYKGNVDDVRESPALEIIELLQERGYTVAVHDPYVDREDFVGFEEALTGSSLALVLVDHDQFKTLDMELVAQLMNEPVLFDTKGIVSSHKQVQVLNYNNLWQPK